MNQERLKEDNAVELLADYNGEPSETGDDLLHDCLNHIDEGFMALNHLGTCRFINPQAASTMKGSPAELKGINIWKAFPQLIHSEFHRSFLRAIETKQPVAFTGYFCYSDSYQAIRLYPSDKGISVFLKKVAATKETRESIGREGHLLRILIDNLPDYIYVKDLGSRHILNNKATIEMLGAGSEIETLGKTVLDYCPDPTLTKKYLEDDRLVVQSEHAQVNKEEAFITPAGETRWVLTTKVPFKDEKNNVAGLVGISRDITDRKRTEMQLQQLNASLEKKAAEFAASNYELEQFAYAASHDLQEPLRMISSFLQLLRKEYQHKLDKTAEQYIFFAVDGAERMKRLIMDLLEYSRLGSGDIGYATTSLDAIMNEVLGTFQESILNSSATIERDELPVMNVNRFQISQLLQNLLGNALKYSSEKPPILTISAKEQPDNWLFSFRDNGIGIEPGFYERIFVIFQRLHNNSKYGGTGIGLALCKKIVEKHGGTIWVESSPGQGSVFHFTISKTL